MAEEIEKFNLNSIPQENAPIIKEEFEEDSYIGVCETSISVNDTELKYNMCDDRIKEYKIASTVDDIKIKLPSFEAYNIVLKDNVKIENEINANEIKTEFGNKLLFCDHCDEHYEDYCTKCGMLAHILNGNPLSIADDRATKGIPNKVLEIRESSGYVGVFTLKVLPESVIIGPFNGLGTSECPLRLKGGQFLVNEDKLKSLNWMRHINPARNMFEHNIIPFQRDDNLYYHSNREILVGEELLVYFGAEYEDSLHKNIEIDFVPPIEDAVRDVYACTFCCLGFSSKEYLAKHKSRCSNEINGEFYIDEIKECPFCKIYFYEKEYLECHKPYCGERNVRKCITLNKGSVETNRPKSTRLQMYKCKQCKYKTAFKNDLKSHVNKHYEVKTYRCEICCSQFKTNQSLKLHAKTKHVDVEAKEDQKRSMRDYMKENTKAGSSKVSRASQYKAKQCLKYEECEICGYKTSYKQDFENHIKSIHLKEFSYECEICDYKTNKKSHLQRHIKTKHLKEYSYECEICDYKTNKKPYLEMHTKSIHLKEFSHECDICDYKTNIKTNLEVHIKTKHLKEFSYECEICNYKTNKKPHLENHMKSIHLKEFRYECEICDYKTNRKSNFVVHTKTKHLREFSYGCEMCDYKTNKKPHLEIHIKTKHLKEFSYECEICDYKVNHKSYFDIHIKTKHLKEFSYECEMCDYKSNNKSHLKRHMNTKHQK